MLCRKPRRERSTARLSNDWELRVKKTIQAALLATLVLAVAWTGHRFSAFAQDAPALNSAEDALAVPGLLGLAHFDLGYAIRAERAYYGEEDQLALPEPLAGDDTVLNALQSNGLDVREMVDEVVAGLLLVQQESGIATVLLGRFPVAKFTEVLKQAFLVEQEQLGADTVFLVRQEDRDSCKLSEERYLHLAEDRIVLASSRPVLALVLERLENGAASQRDLADWRAFRDSRMASVALLSPPIQVLESMDNPFVKPFAKAMQEGLSGIRNIYAGVSLQPVPLSIGLGGRVDAADAAWPRDAVAKVAAWRADVAQNTAANVPSLLRLHDHLRLSAEGDALRFALDLDGDLAGDAGQAVTELVGLAFAGLGFKTPSKSQQAAPKEETVPEEKLAKLANTVSHERLAPFDRSFETGVAWPGKSGPFGVRVSEIALNEEDPQVLDIQLTVTSAEIRETLIESGPFQRNDARAEIHVTGVLDRNGRNLLRDEPCGKERNAVGVKLRPGSSLRRDADGFTNITILQGEKTVRLAPGVGLDDVASLQGHVRLTLPAGYETRQLSAPLAGQAVETAGLRVKFRDSAPHALAYDVSGKQDRLLEIRARNRDGAYLVSDGHSGGARIFGLGAPVTRRFKGEIAEAELLIATGEAARDYAFTIDAVRPAFPERDFAKPTGLEKVVLDAFVKLLETKVLGNACKETGDTTRLGPFRVCPSRFQKWGDGIWGRFELEAPVDDMLQRHLSALEVIFESVTLEAAGKRESHKTKAGSSRVFATGLHDTGAARLRSWETILSSFENPIDVGGQAIVRVQGRLRVRMPKAFSSMTLDVTKLGNEAAHADGTKARLVGYKMRNAGELVVRYSGPRERLVEVIARNRAGGVIGTKKAKVEATDDPAVWILSISVSGAPTALDIVLAEDQHRKDYTFDLPIPH